MNSRNSYILSCLSLLFLTPHNKSVNMYKNIKKKMYTVLLYCISKLCIQTSEEYHFSPPTLPTACFLSPPTNHTCTLSSDWSPVNPTSAASHLLFGVKRKFLFQTFTLNHPPPKKGWIAAALGQGCPCSNYIVQKSKKYR